MTYLEAYEAVLGQLKNIDYPVHEVYTQTLARPCIVCEAHPAASDTLNAVGVLHHLDFMLTFLPVLDARNNIKDQRDVLRFVDAVMETFRPRTLPGMELSVNPAGNAVTEAYVKLSSQFAHAPVVDSGLPMMEEIHFTMR